ncbi:MAG: RiPP maturation radical SAM C-methyltransferase [Candidatus Aminicenantes bacterium]|nr:RiPP maturation radical SAM C-methyltransferase [Candidatus Aminicenantes bacterium]
MNQLKDIKKLILSVLNGGDILFIVPPFAIRDYSILGPHILKSIAEKEGYKTDIFYLNLLFASIIGEDIYDKISKLPYNLRWMKLGERLFARCAYGLPPMGKSPESSADEAMCISGNRQQHVRVSYEAIDFDLDSFLKVEEICTYFIDEIVKVIISLSYKMIGCTTTLEQTNCSIAIINGIKSNRPDIITLIGGSNCERTMAQGIASLSEAIDYVFSGESESSFNNFLMGFSQGRFPSQRIITGETLDNLDTLPLPNYEDFIKQMRHFHAGNQPNQIVIAYETSRGCWRGGEKKCSFCGVDSDNLQFRQKSEDKVLKDLEFIRDNYQATGILMTDNIVPHSYYEKLFPLLSSKKKSPSIWYQENTNLKLKDLIILKKAQTESVLFGIDALSTDMLKHMNKGANARQNLLLLRHAKSVGIYILWFILWGFPGDKIEYYQETLKLLPLIRHFQPPTDFVHLILHRFCSYVENPKNYQIVNLRPLEVYQNIYPDWAELDKLAYEFTGDYPCEAHENPEIIREIVNELSLWTDSWEKSILAMISFAGNYIIKDSRIKGEGRTHIMDYAKAKETMKYCTYNEFQHQKWAVEQKLGVVVDGWYVPLVTASPELLLQFEEK